jgi:hypothetical protein
VLTFPHLHFRFRYVVWCTTMYTWDISLPWLVEWGQISWISGPFHLLCEINKNHQVLLLLENHDSHITVPVISKCRQNGVITPTFPPHTSHKLQSMRKFVFGQCLTQALQCDEQQLNVEQPRETHVYLQCCSPNWSAIPKSFHFI